MLIIPNYNISCSQYGFQKGRGTSFVTCLLNDSILYFKSKKTPVFMCSLDAEKCFDNIWHSGMLYKLWDKVPVNHWLLILRWYKCTSAAVKFGNYHSSPFHVTKGMRQGSVLSPYLFNIFIDDLLITLKNVNSGLRISDFHLNHAAYADDINLVSTTTTGLQNLINTCFAYANDWRFKFGIKKTICVTFGKSLFKECPKMKLGSDTIEFSDDADILGINFDSKMTFSKHAQNRAQKCRQSMFRLTLVGMSYRGLHTSVKSYLWKVIGSPTLVYGMESASL